MVGDVSGRVSVVGGVNVRCVGGVNVRCVGVVFGCRQM